MRPRQTLLAAVVALGAVACVISTTTRPAPGKLDTPAGTVVETPVHAHMRDGSVVVFSQGVTFGSDRMLVGTGTRVSATLAETTAVRRVPLDSVLGFEVWDRKVNPGRTILYSTALTAVGTVAAAGLAVAIFGSCPTIYADSAGAETLQAESFSYSIAPMLAKRDLDRLSVQPDANGVMRLVVKNEAMETHYLDQMELVEFRHEPGETAVPVPGGGVAAVRGLFAPASVRDAAGRDVHAVLAAADTDAFATDPAYLDQAIAGGPVEDHLDVTVARRTDRDTVAIVLRARASLLSTAVLYDYLLSRPGPAAIDWLGHDIGRISTVAQVGLWYTGNFSMRVQVLDHGTWRGVARMANFGPAAWHDVAVAVPAIGDDSVRIRVSFTADEYRIDQLALAWDVRSLEPRAIRAARVIDRDGRSRDDAVRALARPDDRPLVTYPGDRFTAEFDAGVAAPGTRTYMVASHGYYSEWIRPQWFPPAAQQAPFAPSRAPVREVLKTWRAAKDSLERTFFVRRVPVV
jgi:hypothetical protein